MRQATGALISYDPTSQSRLRDDASVRSFVENGHLRLDCFPERDIEIIWSQFLTRLDSPDLYCTPHYFREPYWRNRNPFAILAFTRGEMTGVATGVHHNNEVTC
jgi:hypothetical protein